ncbi:MAG: GGDEF domain-containing protein [Clostridia bacterium]|nr:GGDEF domain-containing protein [Clostridia bacterium]
MKYYTPLTVLVWISLAVLCILVIENGRIPKDRKKILYLTYAIVAAAALAEWAGVQLSGNPDVSPWLIRIAKFFDYSLTPLAGGAILLQLRTKSLCRKILFTVLAANALFQTVSVFTGWMITIDAGNNYSHGPLYFVYMAVYLVSFALVIAEFIIYGKNFQKHNIVSLLSTLVFSITGVVLQEILGGEVRTVYISLALCMAFLFIHNSEFSQLESDERLREQMIQISVDPLTGIASRYAYNAAIQELSSPDELPEDLVVFSFDINGLKTTNDLAGHNAGDELICGGSKCISSVFSSCGTCYRTGGDEFIVIANIGKEMIPELTSRLEKITQDWHGDIVQSLSLSYGKAEASEHPGVSFEKLVSIADQEMYKAKSRYYERTGVLRRLY